MTPLDAFHDNVCPKDPFGWFENVKRVHRLTYNPSQCIGWFECTERGHRLTYDPSQRIGIKQMGP